MDHDLFYDRLSEIDRKLGLINVLVMALCTHHGIAPSLLPGFNADSASATVSYSGRADQTLALDYDRLNDRFSEIERKVHNAYVMLMALCTHLGIDPSLIPGFNAGSAYPVVLSPVTAPSLVPQYASACRNAGGEDEEPSQVPQSDSMHCEE